MIIALTQPPGQTWWLELAIHQDELYGRHWRDAREPDRPVNIQMRWIKITSDNQLLSMCNTLRFAANTNRQFAIEAAKRRNHRYPHYCEPAELAGLSPVAPMRCPHALQCTHHHYKATIHILASDLHPEVRPVLDDTTGQLDLFERAIYWTNGTRTIRADTRPWTRLMTCCEDLCLLFLKRLQIQQPRYHRWLLRPTDKRRKKWGIDMQWKHPELPGCIFDDRLDL